MFLNLKKIYLSLKNSILSLAYLFELKIIKFIFKDSKIKETSKSYFKLISCYNDGSLIMRVLRDESRCDFFESKHSSPVNCILISSNNQMLISGDIDGFIKIWCLQNGLLIRSVANSYSNTNWGIKCMINLPVADEILICSKSAILKINKLL